MKEKEEMKELLVPILKKFFPQMPFHENIKKFQQIIADPGIIKDDKQFLVLRSLHERAQLLCIEIKGSLREQFKLHG